MNDMFLEDSLEKSINTMNKICHKLIDYDLNTIRESNHFEDL